MTLFSRYFCSFLIESSMHCPTPVSKNLGPWNPGACCQFSGGHQRGQSLDKGVKGLSPVASGPWSREGSC